MIRRESSPIIVRHFVHDFRFVDPHHEELERGGVIRREYGLTGVGAEQGMALADRFAVFDPHGEHIDMAA